MFGFILLIIFEYLLTYLLILGIWRANQILPSDGTSRSMEVWKDFVTNFTDVAPLAFGLFGNQCKNPQSMVGKIQEFYHLNDLNPDDPVTDEVAHNVIDVLSDTMFNYAIGKKHAIFQKKISRQFFLPRSSCKNESKTYTSENLLSLLH